MPQRADRLNRFTFIALLSGIVIVLDYITKWAIVTHLRLHESIEVLPFLRIVHVENRGAAFGILADLGNTLFIVIAVIAICAIILYVFRLPRGMEMYALSLILGGAAGNLVDRITRGRVIDFIDVFAGKWHWPAFNVADSALTVGIILFIWSTLRHGFHAKAG